jgi:hypothetical protein
MTPADLSALIERINALAHCSYWANAGWDIPGDATQVIGRLAVQAAAALAELRDSEALARGKIAEQMIEIKRLKEWRISGKDAAVDCLTEERMKRERAEAEVARLKDRLEAQFKRLTSMDGLLANAGDRIAALEAERADLIKINNKWAREWDAMREKRDEWVAKHDESGKLLIATVAERDAIKGDNMANDAKLFACERERDALKVDAERYRKIRDGSGGIRTAQYVDKLVDAAIDAAREQEKK